MDRFYQLLQPQAEYLGRGFQAEPWTITLFSEEIVRGNSLGFVLSILLRHLDPELRQAAHLGNWQIVSRGRGRGRVEVVPALRAIQNAKLDSATVVIADQVSGDEEIPENVTAVLAPDVTDIVSHVAVRARNSNLLFAACHDAALFERLKSMKGRHVQLEVNPAGDVLVEESNAAEQTDARPHQRPPMAIRQRSFSQYAVGLDAFDENLVGGKALHQARLRGKLPDWIHLPKSVAIPFGAFEKVLSLSVNKESARQYEKLLQQAESGQSEVLSELRKTALSLSAPAELPEDLHRTMAAAGLAWPGDWDRPWDRIKRVWASKWNERAFLSRRKMGLPHQQLFMAVLIQEVVPSDYAFVIHTVHPSTNNPDELFAEVVLGLGETLVGNFPGRALSFVWNKSREQLTLLSYPGKSVALYGSGLIFRSDSNGEDQSGYAGAGLYDSVLLDKPRSVLVDYTPEPLVWDEAFRSGLLMAVARVGLEVAKALSGPQDVEGAVANGVYYVVQARPQVGLESVFK
jgi:alpha-glucan,water dikinase